MIGLPCSPVSEISNQSTVILAKSFITQEGIQNIGSQKKIHEVAIDELY